MKRSLVPALLLAGACAQDARDPAPQPGQTATAIPTGPAAGMSVPASILGEYRVAGIDGQPLDAAYGIAVSIGADTISYEPRCLGFAWTYRLAGGTIAIERDPAYGAQTDADGTVTSCLPAVGPEYRQLARALSAAVEVRRTPANALEFSGGGHSVTLFSQ